MYSIAYSQHRGRNPRQQDAIWDGIEVMQSTNLPARQRSVSDGVISHLAVADGVGSSPVPQRASRLALEIFSEAIAEGKPFNPHLIRYVHGRLCDTLAQGRSFGSSTTLTAASCKGGCCQILSVGDSRAYRIDVAGYGHPLTRDHTVLNGMIDRGEADAQIEYASFYNMLDSCLIADDEEIDFQIHHQQCRLSDGDSLLLCTDGVHGALGETTLFSLFDPGLAAKDQVAKWHRALLDAGAEDNFSMILLKYLRGKECDVELC